MDAEREELARRAAEAAYQVARHGRPLPALRLAAWVFANIGRIRTTELRERIERLEQEGDRMRIENWAEPVFGIQMGAGELRTHPLSACEGRGIPCCVHDPSDHAMVTWPMNWRSDTGVMERLCEHGVGHPDPDHMAYVISLSQHNEWQGVHGCDGCCIRSTDAVVKP